MPSKLYASILFYHYLLCHLIFSAFITNNIGEGLGESLFLLLLFVIVQNHICHNRLYMQALFVLFVLYCRPLHFTLFINFAVNLDTFAVTCTV